MPGRGYLSQLPSLVDEPITPRFAAGWISGAVQLGVKPWLLHQTAVGYEARDNSNWPGSGSVRGAAADVALPETARMEAVACRSGMVLRAAMQFDRTVDKEAVHVIGALLDEAFAAKEIAEEEVILFNYCGHGPRRIGL